MQVLWSQEDKDEVAKLWTDEGSSAAEISKLFKTTRSAILGVVSRLGLKRGKDSSQNINKIRNKTKLPTKPFQPPKLARIQSKKDMLAKNQIPEPDPIGPIGDFPDHGCCRFLRDEVTNDFQMCGHKCQEGKSFCDWHLYNVIYQKSPTPKVYAPLEAA